MNHFEISHWADYVRGSASPAERSAMKTHLASRCIKCRRVEKTLRRFAAAASAEGEYQVPPHVLQGVRAIYSLQRPEKVSIFERIVGRLVYDSFREPHPAGVRSRQQLARQVLYRAASYSLYLRLEYQRGGGVTLVGQLADIREPLRPLGNLPVFLLSGQELVAHAFSNHSGEFQMEYQPRRHLRLFIQANQGIQNRIEISLSRIQSRGDAGSQSPRRSVRLAS